MILKLEGMLLRQNPEVQHEIGSDSGEVSECHGNNRDNDMRKYGARFFHIKSTIETLNA